MDLKLEAGDLAALLDLKPTHSLADLCQNAARLDRVLFERSLTRHASGVHLLAPPERLADVVHVRPEGVRQVLALARAVFPYVVVDLDHSFRDDQTKVLHQADIILLVLRLDFASLRNARRTLDHLEQMGIPRDRLRLVVNRHGQPKEVPAAKAEEALGVKIFHFVPDDPKTVNRANNNGVPDGPGSPLGQGLQEPGQAGRQRQRPPQGPLRSRTGARPRPMTRMQTNGRSTPTADGIGRRHQPALTPEERFLRYKKELHQQLITGMDLAAIGTMDEEELRAGGPPRRRGAVPPELRPAQPSERERLVNEVLDETFGLGPLEPLLHDPTITDILINGPKIGLRRAHGAGWSGSTSLPRRPAPAPDHPADRRPGRPPGRRDLPDGRRPPARRQPRQRDHPAAGPRRRRCCRSAASAPSRCWSHDLVGQAGDHAGDGRVPRRPASRRGSTCSSPAAPAAARRRC